MGQKQVVVIAADLHSGSKVSLITTDKWELVDGGYYIPSAGQQVIARQWQVAWEKVAETVQSKLFQTHPKLTIIIAGDTIEGTHHTQSQLITSRKDEQERIHVAAMQQAFKICDFDPERDELRYVSGTEVHDGTGSSSPERIVRALTGKAQLDSRVVTDHLRREYFGVLLDIAHHGPGPGQRRWTRSNPLRLTLQDYYLQCLELQQPIPRYYIRAHRHQFVTADVRHSLTGQIATEGFLLPSWTLKTDYVYSRAAHTLANIGLLIITISSNGETTWHCEHLIHDQDEILREK